MHEYNSTKEMAILTEPSGSIISVGIDNIEIINNDNCIAKVPCLAINEDYNQLDNLRQFCNRFDVVMVLADLTQQFASKILKKISAYKKHSQIFVLVISDEFTNNICLDEYKKNYQVIFSQHTTMEFHEVAKIIYSIFETSFFGCYDLSDIIEFFKWSSSAKHYILRHTNFKSEIKANKVYKEIDTIINTTPTNNFSIFIVFQIYPDIDLAIIEDLAKVINNEKSGYSMWNIIFDEKMKESEIAIHMLVGR